MISVKLKNPEIILTPITAEEKEQLEKDFMGDESIYVLYRLPDSEEIHIGMMSSSIGKYFPVIANIWNLDNATTKAFFYNGCSELENIASQITDRPVYRVVPNDDRTVYGYSVLNATKENNLYVPLEDIVDENYTLNDEKTPILKRI